MLSAQHSGLYCPRRRRARRPRLTSPGCGRVRLPCRHLRRRRARASSVAAGCFVLRLDRRQCGFLFFARALVASACPRSQCKLCRRSQDQLRQTAGRGGAARTSLRSGMSPSMLEVPWRDRESRLAQKARVAAKERRADQRCT